MKLKCVLGVILDTILLTAIRIEECHHCDAEHSTGYYKCKEFKYPKKIITLQKRHKLSRQQSINRYKTMYSSNDRDYSRVVTTPILGNRNDASTNNIPSTSTATIQRGADHSPSTPSINSRPQQQTPKNEQQTHAKRRRGSKGETAAATSKKRVTEVVCTDPDTGRLYTAPVEIENPEDSSRPKQQVRTI